MGGGIRAFKNSLGERFKSLFLLLAVVVIIVIVVVVVVVVGKSNTTIF